jgi:molecular chaperone GrpE
MTEEKARNRASDLGDPEAGELELDVDGDAGADFDALTREALAAVDQGAADAEATSTAAEVTKLEREIADLRDRSIRTLADFDNFRKRADREREDIRRYATSELLRDLLGVVDNLNLALAAGGGAEDLKLGVELTLRQFADLLRRYGVREVPALGERFDPAHHEAVSKHEDPAVTVPTVVEELRRGYFLHDRLLRPAMVRVALPDDSGAGGEDAQ